MADYPGTKAVSDTTSTRGNYRSFKGSLAVNGTGSGNVTPVPSQNVGQLFP